MKDFVNGSFKKYIKETETSFSQLKFNAKAGETYTIHTNIELDGVDFFVTNSEGAIVTKTKSIKQPEVSVPTYTPKYAPQM